MKDREVKTKSYLISHSTCLGISAQDHRDLGINTHILFGRASQLGTSNGVTTRKAYTTASIVISLVSKMPSSVAYTVTSNISSIASSLNSGSMISTRKELHDTKDHRYIG